LLGGFEQAANSVVRSQRNNRKIRKWTTPKWVRIRPKYSATITFSWQENKDGQNKKQKLITCTEYFNNIVYLLLILKKLANSVKPRH